VPQTGEGMKFNPGIHERRSIRLADYDYTNAGAYFLTICAWERECLFGEITDGEMVLNGRGKIVRDEWFLSAVIRKEIILDEFIVMPNHLHGIICINGGVGATRWVAQNQDNGGCDMTNNCVSAKQRATHARATHRVAPTGPVSGSIGAIVGQFKSAVTKRINAVRDNPGCPVWQRNYFERVIRNERELATIRDYIANNPMKWAMDKENPVNRGVDDQTT